MDTDKYIAYIKTDDKDIAKYVKFRLQIRQTIVSWKK